MPPGGQNSAAVDIGLTKSADELQNWRPDIPGAGAQQQAGSLAEEAAADLET